MSFKFNPFTGNLDIAEGEAGAPGAPGGSSGQIQWNSSGSFAGVSTTSVDGTGNLTFTGRWIQSTNNAASAPPMALTGTWFTSGGTSTTTKPQFLIEPAGTTSTNWSTAGTGLGVNAPNGFTGSLLDLQINGASILRVQPEGQIFVGGGAATISANTFSAEQNNNSGIIIGNYAGRGIFLGATAVIAFTSLSPASTRDLFIQRDAANTLAQRNGTNAQTSRIYNTFTSDTNFERLNIRWASNQAIIDTEAGSGGGTLRGLRIGSAATSLLGFYNATPVAQPAAVVDATDAASVITQLNLALARLRTLGLIAT